MLFQKAAGFTLEKLGDTGLVSIKVVASMKCGNGIDVLEAI